MAACGGCGKRGGAGGPGQSLTCKPPGSRRNVKDVKMPRPGKSGKRFREVGSETSTLMAYARRRRKRRKSLRKRTGV